MKPIARTGKAIDEIGVSVCAAMIAKAPRAARLSFSFYRRDV
jgi:hypothetical protein